MAPSAVDPDRLEWLAAALGTTVEIVGERTHPWASATRTLIVATAEGERLVLQTMRDPLGKARMDVARMDVARRARIARLLPALAPWLPIPEVVAVDPSGPNPALVTRFVEGRAGNELFATNAEAGRLGALLGGLILDLRLVPLHGLHLPGPWTQPERLQSAARRWAGAIRRQLTADEARTVGRLIEAAPAVLFDRPVVFVHGDPSPVNVLVRGRRIVAVLDLERARVGPALFDAAWVRWVVRHHHPNRWPAFDRQFRAAAGIDSSPGTEHTLELLGALQCLEGFARQPAARASERSDWARRLKEILGRLE